MLADLQRQFRAAVLGDTDGALSSARVDVRHGTAAQRIDVYRNTVQTGLIEVLATAFPVVRRIVGAAFFDGFARDFVRLAPPRVPQLSLYGSAFADFIAGKDREQRLPYLPDVARLEWARGEAYFAADAACLDPHGLSAIPAESLVTLQLELHPATRVVRSAFPIVTIWQVNQPETMTVPGVDMSHAECAVITRPGFQVLMETIGDGDAAFLDSVSHSDGLGAAVAAALSADPAFSFQDALQGHLRRGTFRSPDTQSP